MLPEKNATMHPRTKDHYQHRRMNCSGWERSSLFDETPKMKKERKQANECCCVNQRRRHRRRVGVNDYNHQQLPVIPHTAVVEILSFCDFSTLVAFRAVSKIFRHVQIPREMNCRAMKKLRPGTSHYKSSRAPAEPQLQGRQPGNPAVSPYTDCSNIDNNNDDDYYASTSSYDSKQKLVDEEHRKAWIFTRDSIERREILPCLENTEKSYPSRWSLKTVITQLLDMIQDNESYDGAFLGYDRVKARALLFQKGFIDETDFPLQHQETRACRKRLLRYVCGTKHRSGDEHTLDKENGSDNMDNTEICSPHGKWRAEARIRQVSLAEALRILSEKESSLELGARKRPAFWEQLFARLKPNLSEHAVHGNSSDRIIRLLFTLAMANARPTFHLAEYSTLFDGLEMTCRVLLFRTVGGLDTELRLVSGHILV